MGGKFTHAVDREVTTYSATVLKADVPKAMEILAGAAKVGRRWWGHLLCCSVLCLVGYYCLIEGVIRLF